MRLAGGGAALATIVTAAPRCLKRGGYIALWWVPAGHEPSVQEATARLEELRTNGDTPRAFSFTHTFPAPDAPAAAVRGFADTCPAL